MKILVVSDEIDPLVYSDNVRERFHDVELVISCGDLPNTYYDFIVSSLNVPLFYVLGNHPPPMKERQGGWREIQPPGCTNLDGRVVSYKGLLFGGFAGSLRYNRDQWSTQFTDFEMRAKAWRLAPRLAWNRLFRGRGLDVLVTHAPPLGIGDQPDRCHTGFAAFPGFLRRWRPRYHLHGHVHLWDRNAPFQTRYHATEVVNAYGFRVIELGPPA